MTKKPDFIELAKSTTSDGVLAAAQDACAPEISDHRAALAHAVSVAPRFGPPAEPTIEEQLALTEQLISAWRSGEDGRKILDDFDHPWINSSERREAFTMRTMRLAQSRIEETIAELRRPNEDHIEWLNTQLLEALELVRANPQDLNARTWFATHYDNLRWAWTKTISRLGEIDPHQFRDTPAYFANAEEISEAHLRRLDGEPVVADDRWPRRPGEMGEWIIDHPAAEPWFPTREQLRAKRYEMNQAITATKNTSRSPRYVPKRVR